MRELETLFLRWRDDGDVDALARAFDAIAPKLLAVARHLAHDEATAEDFVQATFLTALRHARRSMCEALCASSVSLLPSAS